MDILLSTSKDIGVLAFFLVTMISTGVVLYKVVLILVYDAAEFKKKISPTKGDKQRTGRVD